MYYTFSVANVCIFQTVKECDVPSPPHAGSVAPAVYRVKYDETITYSCDRKYRLVGQAEATCQEDRTFSSPPPRCNGE